MEIKKLAIIVPLILSSSMAFADSNIYLGGKVGFSSAHGFDDAVTNSTSVDKSDTAYGIFIGYKIRPTFAIEAGYNYLGEYDLENVSGGSYTASSFDVVAKASGALTEELSLYAKAGFGYYDWNAKGTGVESDDSGITPTLAFGADYSFHKDISAGLEYQLYTDIGGVQIGSVNLLFAYSW